MFFQKEESGFLKPKIEERYDRLITIGEGTYGKVYKGLDKVTGRTIALKRIKLENEEEGIPPTSLREIAILKELNHMNIVKYNLILIQQSQKTLSINENIHK